MYLVKKKGQTYSLGFRRMLNVLGAVAAGRDPVLDDLMPYIVINLDGLSKAEARRKAVSLIDWKVRVLVGRHLQRVSPTKVGE